MKFISTITPPPPSFDFVPFEQLRRQDFLFEPMVIIHDDYQQILSLLGDTTQSFHGVILNYADERESYEPHEPHELEELHFCCWRITIPRSEQTNLFLLLKPMLSTIAQCLEANSKIDVQKINLERANRVISELKRDYQDITVRLVGQLEDLRGAKDLLALSQSHIRHIINLMPQHVFAVDSDGLVLLCNDAMARSFSLSSEEVMQRNISEFDFGNQWLLDSDEADTWVNRHQERNDLVQTWRMIRGEKRYFRLTKIPYQFGASDQSAILTVADDITPQHHFEHEIMSLNQRLEKRVEIRTQELAQTNDALLAAKLEAERASQAKSDFLATMSHEIRTPMNAVIGLLELFEGDNLSEEQVELLDNVVNSARLLLSILNDILDLSKIEAGKIEIDNRPIRFPELVKHVISGMANLADQKDLALDFSIAEAVPEALICDEIRIRQILYNLCSNAIKFTQTTVEKKGQIRVTVEAEALVTDKSLIVICIADNGIGMDEQTQTKIFKPFSQADASTTRQYGGTGLGLHICKQLISLLGGEISCESEINRGTTFICKLPMAHAALAPAQVVGQSATTSTDVVPEALRRKTILVAEDNPVNRLVFDKQLKKLGIEAIMVNDGYAALDYWRANEVDLIFTDCNMPHMDGFELTRIIRSEEERQKKPEIPIIAVTANALKGDGEKCLKARMNDYLTKPVNLSQLKTIIFKYGNALKRQG